jgi:hypothetical protein
MGTKTKTFDCVEMKYEAQRRLRAEYEARRSEFASYVDFINRTIDEHPWERDLWARISAGSKKRDANPE